MFKNAYIPYGGYYSTPFAKWQGSLQNENSIKLTGNTSKRFFEEKGFDPGIIEYVYFGHTVIQPGSFYSAPYGAAEMGINVPGQSVSHACATSTTAVFNAASAIETTGYSTVYVMLGDRLSNAPHVVWPNPLGMGGMPMKEDINIDNINGDPSTGQSMLSTAENVAKEYGFTREEADELTRIRYEQYEEAIKNDRAFQKRYMFPIRIKRRKGEFVLTEDEGVFPTTMESLAKLKPIIENGIHTFGSQTHPADGNAGIIVTNREHALEIGKDKNIPVQIVAYGATRTKRAFMPAAPADAAKIALERGGVSAKDLKSVKNHTPFIVNDLHFAKELGLDKKNINNYGTSMVFGHPQGPTMGRLLIEAIEETVIKGGGYALVAGCAAGDNAAALLVKIG